MAKKKTEETVAEAVEVSTTKEVVTLIKDDVLFTLSDPIMISAFENQGYERLQNEGE